MLLAGLRTGYAHHLAGACHFLYGLCGSRISSRLRELDRSIEEAAMDLGRRR